LIDPSVLREFCAAWADHAFGGTDILKSYRHNNPATVK
jgi:hypothetical protein